LATSSLKNERIYFSTLKKSYDLGKYAPLYRSAVMGILKEARQGERDNSPTLLDFGPVRFWIARQFWFLQGSRKCHRNGLSGFGRKHREKEY